MSSQPDDVLTEVLDMLERFYIDPGGLVYPSNKKLDFFDARLAIKALIDEAVREARIDTLDDCYGYWHVNGGVRTGQFIKERMAELQKPTKEIESD